jgi:type V secretory pathway adhesin AidA
MASRATAVFFPQIVALGANSFRGGFQIANTTATATTCTYTFSNGDVVNNVPLAANGSNSVFAESALTNNKTNFNGSVRVQCGQPIVGIYNLSIIGGAAAGDPVCRQQRHQPVSVCR